MKKLKHLILLMAFVAIFALAACNVVGDSSGSSSVQNAPQLGLQLLRIETDDDANNGGGYALTASYMNQAIIKPLAETTDTNQVEEIETTHVGLVAVIKNENRASFIDMVVYNSQNDKTAVYNEGNGTYQCSSETIYEDDMWVTNIRFSADVELTADDFYFEIKEIKFLRNNTDEKADLNTVDVRKKDFRFSTAYYDAVATVRLEQNLESVKQGGNFTAVDTWVDLNIANKTVQVGWKDALADETPKFYGGFEFLDGAEITMPESLSLQYYENRELKSGEFVISRLLIGAIWTMDPSSGEMKDIKGFFNLKTNCPISFIDYKDVYYLTYAEGVKTCVLDDSISTVNSLVIPSTCQEIYCTKMLPKITYNGMWEQFVRIEGAMEFVAQRETYAKKNDSSFIITCTDTYYSVQELVAIGGDGTVLNYLYSSKDQAYWSVKYLINGMIQEEWNKNNASESCANKYFQIGDDNILSWGIFSEFITFLRKDYKCGVITLRSAELGIEGYDEVRFMIENELITSYVLLGGDTEYKVEISYQE